MSCDVMVSKTFMWHMFVKHLCDIYVTRTCHTLRCSVLWMVNGIYLVCAWGVAFNRDQLITRTDVCTWVTWHNVFIGESSLKTTGLETKSTVCIHRFLIHGSFDIRLFCMDFSSLHSTNWDWFIHPDIKCQCRKIQLLSWTNCKQTQWQ